MAGVLYQWCVGCQYREDTPKTVKCPATFNPYDTDICPKVNGYNPPENYREFKRREEKERR